MFDELKKYKSGHFFLTATDNIANVCNAPDKHGVLIVYALARGKVDLVYIGQTNFEDKNQPSLKDEIVNGGKFKKLAGKMKREKVEALDIYWYVTYDKAKRDAPEDVLRTLLQNYINLYGTLPKWNTV